MLEGENFPINHNNSCQNTKYSHFTFIPKVVTQLKHSNHKIWIPWPQKCQK